MKNNVDINSLKAKADNFKKLHEQSSLFVMPCAWDAFSALLCEQAGFRCIGTTSGGVNWINGRQDYIYSTPKEHMLHAYAQIAHATPLPVSGDLENGYGSTPEDVADTIEQSVMAGMVGGSIEDSNIVPTDEHFTNGELYPIDVAIERIRAAKTAAINSEINYTLTARCEVYYTNELHPFKEAVRRLTAYKDAGADCLFVPGLNNLKELEQLVKEVDGPISFGMGATESPVTLSMLEDIGIRRVSTGGGLTRAAFGFIQKALGDIQLTGTFDYLGMALSESDVNQILDIPKG